MIFNSGDSLSAITERKINSNIYFCGDSITYGTNASSANTGYPGQIATQENLTFTNYAVAGQTITQNTDNFFLTSSIPTKTVYDLFLCSAWGVNDCWKEWSGNAATVANFQTNYQAYVTAALAKGWSTGSIKFITGFYIIDPVATNPGTGLPYFTNAVYQTYVAGTVALANSLSIQCIDLTGTTYSTSDNVHPANDAAYTIIKNSILTQLII